MLFSSLTFLYYFLPAVLIVYFLVPDRGKNLVLFLASLLFYGWGEPKYVALMLLTITLFYLCGRNGRGRSWFFPWCWGRRCWVFSSTPTLL